MGRAVEDDARQARVHLVQRHQLHLFLSSCNVQHATCNVQRATCNVQRATCSMEHAACNVQHATCNIKRAAWNMQHATCNVQRATCNTSRCHSGVWSHRFLPQSLTAAARVQRSERRRRTCHGAHPFGAKPFGPPLSWRPQSMSARRDERIRAAGGARARARACMRVRARVLSPARRAVRG